MAGVPDGHYRGKEVFLVPGQTSPASLTAPSGAGNLAWYPARLRRRPQTPRPLGNLQTTCLSLSDPSETFKQPVWAFPTPRKPSNNLFGPFRPLGNLQTTCLGLSDPSETFKQPVWAFPTPRKPSNNLFEPFRPLGNLQTTCLSLSDPSEGGTNIHYKVFPAHPAYLCRRLSGIGMRCERSDTMSDYYLLLRDYSNYY